MRKRMKKTRLAVFALAACLCSATGAFAWKSEVASAEASPITELFKTSGITLDAMQIDSELLYEEQALCLTSFDVEETIEWKQDVSGSFSFDYMPVTLNGNETAKTFVTEFTDISDGDSFKVVIEHGSTIEVSVEFNGVKAGIFYSSQSTTPKLITQLANESGNYTQFSADKIRVTFDPDTMTVSAGNADDVQFTVWSMLQSENDGRDVGQTLKPFNAYRVAFGITKFLDENGAVLLYSVNDYDMTGLLLSGSGTPAIYADYQYDAMVGEKYVLPEATAYDIADGNIKPSCTIYDPQDNKVAENATSFTPTTAGEYTVVYTAKNSCGTTAEKEYVLQVYDGIPESEYELNWDLNAEYVVGEKVTFPVCTLSGGLIRYGEEKGTLTVKRNGVTLRAYKNIVSGVSYAFQTAGEYEVIYALGGGRETSYTLSVIGADNRFVTDGVAATYQKGDVVDCSAAYMLVGGESVPYEFSVEYPNGRKYKNKVFKADLSGVYHLRATASVAGKDYAFEKQFTVALTKNDQFKTISDQVNISTGRSNFTGKSGAVISVAQSGLLVEYTKPVDLSTFSGQTEMRDVVPKKGEPPVKTTAVKETANPVIDFTVDPAAYGTAAAGGVFVYITDAADPNNKITISIMADKSPTWSYVRAGAPGQDLTGFHVGTSGKDLLDNTPGTLHAGKVGFITYHSFSGKLITSTTGANSRLTLYYDNDTKQVLCTPKIIGNNYQSYIVTDLDDVNYTLGNAWQGFTSDKVYISFMVMGLVAPKANMVVYNVAGEDFSNATFSQDEKPTVDVAGEDTLTGLKGSSLALPAATAYDASGTTIENVVSKVYYKKDGVRYDVPVRSGRFDTNRSGEYEIEYTAIDGFGNRGTRCVRVNVLESAADLRTEFQDALDQDYTQCLAGSYVRLLTKDELAVENAFGDVTTVCAVYYGAGDDRKEVELKNGRFFADRIGSYTVEFVTTDSIGRTTTSSYTVDAAKPESPVIYGNMPYYVGFIRGNTYTISDLYFIDFAKSPEVQKASVYINGEAYTESTFSLPKLVEEETASEEVEMVELEYKYGDKTLYSYSIPVKTVYKKATQTVSGRPITQTYFLSDRYFLFDEEISGVTKSNHLLLSTMSDDATLCFVQPVDSNLTELRLSTNTDQNAAAGTPNALASNISGITLYLTDAMDANKRLTAQIVVAEDGSLYMVVGGETSLPLSGSLTGLSWEAVQFSYRNDSKAFYDAKTGLLIVKPATYDNGEPFEGFSDQVYVALSMQRENVADAATLRLYSINGQSFSDTMKEDNVAPTVIVNGSVSGIYDVGTELKTFTASASDVLSNMEEFYVTITLERNGQTEIVKDLNGNPIEKLSPTQEYAFRLEKIGEYRIVYYAKDGRGMETESVFVITSVQRSKPTITLSGEVPEAVQLNGTVELPTASVQYMEENESNLSYMIYITPSNCYETVENNSFVANEEGIYRVRYYALDAYGNYTMLEYQIVCAK